MLVGKLITVFVPHRLFETLAPFGGFLFLAFHTGLFEKASTTNFRKNPIFLNFFVKALECLFETFALVYNNLSHIPPPFLSRIWEVPEANSTDADSPGTADSSISSCTRGGEVTRNVGAIIRRAMSSVK